MKENELEKLEKERKVIEPILYLIKLLRGDEGLPSDIIFKKSEAWADDLKDLLRLYEQEKEKNKELEKKNKIIELMTNALYDEKYEELICMEVDCKHMEVQNGGKCIGKDCITEYFERKAEEELKI